MRRRPQAAHVIQSDERSLHQISTKCPCNPIVTPIPREDGTIGELVTHNPWKGRKE